jgi:hypothetical protein
MDTRSQFAKDFCELSKAWVVYLEGMSENTLLWEPEKEFARFAHGWKCARMPNTSPYFEPDTVYGAGWKASRATIVPPQELWGLAEDSEEYRIALAAIAVKEDKL